MKPKIILVLLILICGMVMIAGCTTNNGNTTNNGTNISGYKDVTPAEAQKLINSTPEIVIIDVSAKFDQGHLPGAVNYPVFNGSLDNAIPTLNKNDTYLVYCHVDSVAIEGAQKLIDAGFTKVYRLEGNYQAWVDAGYPVET